ncbi:MAG: DUF1566 domain-containing protein [Glaciecola sp.]
MKLITGFLLLTALSVSYAQTEQAEATCPAAIPTTADDAEFVLMRNGVTLHIDSNLIFMRCSIGQTWDGASCVGEPLAHTWQQALETSLSNTFNESKNWRLPNLKELSVLTERACVRPSINDTIFPNTSPDDYWTSSPSMLDENSAWAIAFSNGSNNTKLKTRSLFVRLVRTRLPGESLLE